MMNASLPTARLTGHEPRPNLAVSSQQLSEKENKAIMKSVHVELPDKLAEEMNLLVTSGWFRNEEEVVRTALLDFLRRHRTELLERFQREDIAWALAQKETPRP